jgi:hypothetical protein
MVKAHGEQVQWNSRRRGFIAAALAFVFFAQLPPMVPLGKMKIWLLQFPPQVVGWYFLYRAMRHAAGDPKIGRRLKYYVAWGLYLSIPLVLMPGSMRNVPDWLIGYWYVYFGFLAAAGVVSLLFVWGWCDATADLARLAGRDDVVANAALCRYLYAANPAVFCLVLLLPRLAGSQVGTLVIVMLCYLASVVVVMLMIGLMRKAARMCEQASTREALSGPALTPDGLDDEPAR